MQILNSIYIYMILKPMKHRYGHGHQTQQRRRQPTLLLILKNHIIQFNYMCWYRVGVGHVSCPTPKHA